MMKRLLFALALVLPGCMTAAEEAHERSVRSTFCEQEACVDRAYEGMRRCDRLEYDSETAIPECQAEYSAMASRCRKDFPPCW